MALRSDHPCHGNFLLCVGHDNTAPLKPLSAETCQRSMSIFPRIDELVLQQQRKFDPSAGIRYILPFDRVPKWRYALSSRYCRCINTNHKSNHVWIEVDFKSRTIYQGCYDETCIDYLTKAPFRSTPIFFQHNLLDCLNTRMMVAPRMLAFILDKFPRLFSRCVVQHISRKRALLVTGLACLPPPSQPKGSDTSDIFVPQFSIICILVTVNRQSYYVLSRHDC